jgi:hypothetical protein
MNEKGFFQSLFDLEFKELVTKRIVSTLFVISIIVSALFALGIIIDGFTDSFFWGLVKLIIVAPLVFLLQVTFARVILEVVMVVFKISENIAIMAGRGTSDVIIEESDEIGN